MDGSTLYVADRGNHRVVAIQPDSTNATAIIGSGYGSASDQFDQPTDVFVTNTSIYVLDTYNFRVQMWPRDGYNSTTVAGVTGALGSTASTTTFGYSYGIFVDNAGYLYVSDLSNYRILRFPPGSTSGTSSAVVAGTGTAGAGPTQLDGPHQIFVDEARTIYITDSNNHRIQKWVYGACAGVTVAGTGTPGSTTSQLNYPVDVLVDSNQYMYIGDQWNHRILRWAPGDCSGQCLVGCTQTYGPGANQLFQPTSLAFDSQGSLYVSDGGNHRVQKFGLVKDFGKYQSRKYFSSPSKFRSTDIDKHYGVNNVGNHTATLSSRRFRLENRIHSTNAHRECFPKP